MTARGAATRSTRSPAPREVSNVSGTVERESTVNRSRASETLTTGASYALAVNTTSRPGKASRVREIDEGRAAAPNPSVLSSRTGSSREPRGNTEQAIAFRGFLGLEDFRI